VAPALTAATGVIELPPIEVRAPRPPVPPAYRDTPLPAYPPAAREQGTEGVVLLNVQVGSDGRVAEIRVKASSGSRLLDDSAVAAVKTWTFVPARQGARAVESWVEIPVRFALTQR
jgi:periplasmic protein TonB